MSPVDRQADRAAGVGDAAGDRLADPPGGVGRELEALAPVELLDGVIRPRLPSWIRSSSGKPDAWYFLAIETTSRRFDWTKVRSASSPSRAARRSSRLRPGPACRQLPRARRAVFPASMAWARRTSSSLVSSGYCPMSVSFGRTRSSSSRSACRSFGQRLFLLACRFGEWGAALLGARRGGGTRCRSPERRTRYLDGQDRPPVATGFVSSGSSHLRTVFLDDSRALIRCR